MKSAFMAGLLVRAQTPVSAFVHLARPGQLCRQQCANSNHRMHVRHHRQHRTAMHAAAAPKTNSKKRGRSNPELDKVLEKYEPVVGVEIHVQLLSKTKAYCSCSTEYNPNSPNTNICPVCMGEPGSLPIPNANVVEIAAKASMALGCKVATETKWDRKNYFYPDTPKNYQITQYDQPLGEHGQILLPSGRQVGITRLHMEEDSAKMNHQGAASLSGSTHSLVDFNRAGHPLAEVVSEPDMRSGAEAAEYGKEMQKILRYIGASDGNMAEGSLRLDINVSLRPKGATELNTKVELKNLNSFRAVQDATDFEVVRQAKCYDAGEDVLPETRLWDDKEKRTKVMRLKEGLADYRYFPEPDIPRLILPPETIEQWRQQICELPADKLARYQTQLGLPADDAGVLTEDHNVALYFEEAVKAGADPPEAAKWVVGDIMGYLNSAKKGVSELGLTPAKLAEMVGLVRDGKITGKIVKELLPELLPLKEDGGWPGGVAELVKERGMEAITDPKVIEDIVRSVMLSNQDKVEQYRKGKVKLAGFFVGQVMTQSSSRADPETAQRITKQLLDGQ